MVLRFDSVSTVTTLLEPHLYMLVETQSSEYLSFGKSLFVGPHSAQLEGRPEDPKQSASSPLQRCSWVVAIASDGDILLCLPCSSELLTEIKGSCPLAIIYIKAFFGCPFFCYLFSSLF